MPLQMISIALFDRGPNVQAVNSEIGLHLHVLSKHQTALN